MFFCALVYFVAYHCNLVTNVCQVPEVLRIAGIERSTNTQNVAKTCTCVLGFGERAGYTCM